MVQKTPIYMIIGFFNINFEDYPFLSWSPFLVHQLIANQTNIQNLSPVNKVSLWIVDGIMEDFV